MDRAAVLLYRNSYANYFISNLLITIVYLKKMVSFVTIFSVLFIKTESHFSLHARFTKQSLKSVYIC